MPNRLAAEKSPYLRQHAGNPVDWYPWGDEAFAKARAEQKPVFLSIGYSTCHWCHVMAHESFEDPEVARLLNEHFVPVKLDREERPDVDRVYMAYVQAVTGSGGWPLSAWLTPDLKPIFGGTYFPPEDRHGRAGFKSILRAVAAEWAKNRDRLLAEAEQTLEGLRRYAREGAAHAEPRPDSGPWSAAADGAWERAFNQFNEAFDPAHGGFGGAPKFPRPAALAFLLRVAARPAADRTDAEAAAKITAFTLQKMAEGGIHDHVGGGFHRYSVDDEWFVPHFEKMLYDQAQLALACLDTRQQTGREVFGWLARDILDYVRRELTDPAGGFYSAEDADSEVRFGSFEHAEGAYYVWTYDQLEIELGADVELFAAHFGVKRGGNVEADPHGEFRGRNILRQRQSLAVTARQAGLAIEAANEQLLAGLGKLQQARIKRPSPHRDDKVITAWNGLMISACARAAQVLGDASALAAGTRAAEFLRRELWDEATGTLYRSWREGRGASPGFAEDHACLIAGLLDLYEAGFALRWLQWAAQLQARMDADFWDEERGGYFNSRAGDPAVLVRLKDDYDGAEPAPNSLALANLVRLDWMLGLPGARAKAEHTAEALQPQWAAMPQAMPAFLCGLEWLQQAPATVVLAGDPAAPDFQALAAVLHERPGRRRAVLALAAGPGRDWLARHRPYLAAMGPQEGRATAYVCADYSCQPPARTPDELRRQLA
jgi:hypothetical protein